MSDKFSFDDDFQLGIFEICMIDSHFLSKTVSWLKPEYFKNEYYAYFFITIKKLYDQFNNAPSHMQIKNELMLIVPEKREIYLKLFQRILNPKKYDHLYIRHNLEIFCKKAMNLHIHDIIRKNNNENPDHVNEMISKLIDEQKNISFNSATCQTLGQLTTILQKSSEDSKRLIPTFLPTIDKALSGGVPRGTLTIGLSGTNVGKSIWLINWAYHLIINGFKVFYINLEGYEYQTMLRLASRATGVPLGKLRFNQLNDIELQNKNNFESKYKDSIQIFHNASFDFKLEDLISIARQKKEEFDYDVIMIDYGQILKSKKNYSELRHEQSYIHRAISSLSSELDVAGITVAQGNRDTQEKNQKGNGLIRVNDISECFEIIRAAATVMTLNRSDKDIEMDMARILLDKQRDGQVGIIEVCKTNFSRMAFYGHYSEGLGFINMDEYVKQSAQQ